MFRKIVLFIGLSCLAIGCGSLEDDKEEKMIPGQGVEENLVWSKKSIVDEEGKKIMEVKFNNETFNIPVKYRALNPPHSPKFHTIFLWPGLLPVKGSRRSKIKHDAIRVIYGPKNYSGTKFRDTYLIMQQHKQQGWVSEAVQSPEYPGMKRYNYGSSGVFYEFSGEDIRTPSGNPLVTMCTWQKHEGHKTTLCRIGITWSNELTFRYEFRNYRLVNELPQIHQGIIELIKSFYGE